MKRDRSVILIILALIVGIVLSYFLFFANRISEFTQRKQAMEMMHKLGAGINIGNDLDVYGIESYIDNPTISDYERAWGNVPATKELFSCVKAAGFSSVRIPVTWSEHLLSDNSIDPEWMDRVTEVVTDALDEGLYVVLDTHHELFIVPTYDGEMASTDQLVKIWGQIAENFRDYDERLLFEGMNEPRLRDSKEEWTDGNEELRTAVNRMNRAFVETVRASGGHNETRYLLVGAYATGYKKHALEHIDIFPDDRHIMISVHAYLPRKFTDADRENELWNEEDPSFTEEITELSECLNSYFISKSIPVVITEYGCQDKADEAQRVLWADYFVGTFAKMGISTMWWDDGSDYMIINREKYQVARPELVSTITGFYSEK